MSGERARIVIAERWSVLRRGLIGLFQGVHTVVDHFDDVADLRYVLTSRPVDLALVGDETGLELVPLLEDLCGRNGVPPLVVLADDMDADRLRSILRAGAKGVFSKKANDTILLDGIERVLAGDRVIDQRFIPLLFAGDDLDAEGDDGDDCLLTPRERDVLVFLSRGCSNREIAELLTLGESTVKTHLRRIYAKLEVDGRHHAVGRAMELGLLR